jgi:hypothetical protein
MKISGIPLDAVRKKNPNSFTHDIRGTSNSKTESTPIAVR